MGFGTVVSHIILFVSIITVAAGFLVVINNYVQGATGSIEAQQERISSKIRTDITITSVDYDNTTNPDTITVSARNTGETKLEVNRTDVFIDDLRISRDQTTISIAQDTAIDNPSLWDPNEVVEATTEKDLSNGRHTISFVVENGVKESESFST